MKDIIIDTCTFSDYTNPIDINIKLLFEWIYSSGVLTISQKLLTEYNGTGSQIILSLLAKLQADGRINFVKKTDIDSFNTDKHYKYTCNFKDKCHARLVFISHRKKLVSKDSNLRCDVNNFKKVNKIKPEAVESPEAEFYL